MMFAVKYVADHWRGKQGFAWSFWVNLVLLRLLILLVQEVLGPASGSDYSDRSSFVFIAAFFFHGVVFLWQVVGVLRAGEAHLRGKGSIVHVWGAQCGALIAFWLTASYALDTWYMTLPAPDAEIAGEPADGFAMTSSADGRTITISGTIELGATRSLSALLAQAPGTRTIVLDSAGGNIYAARGLARLVRDHRLDTYVDRVCASACVTVFISGVHRMMLRNGRLGFHQYRLDARYPVPGADPAAEQEHDRQLFLAGNVSRWFVDKIFTATATEMWFPTQDELLRARVVHRIVDDADGAPVAPAEKRRS